MAVHLVPKSSMDDLKKAEQRINRAYRRRLPSDLYFEVGALLTKIRKIIETAKIKNDNHQALLAENGGQL
ncbi:MAG: hypothetical protein JSU85_04995 [Candidatus Zixiibacteriota bacterium]|nr:MAG: hypothetical protein JSU85_04995 [candidate division Zixibacteria bacterium]